MKLLRVACLCAIEEPDENPDQPSEEGALKSGSTSLDPPLQASQTSSSAVPSPWAPHHPGPTGDRNQNAQAAQLPLSVVGIGNHE